ncbi:quinone oxidoreductase family protein [Streptomonospora nanhaiensis]|uniref:NADPH2:quinone reductase n=1 Tax=Streptomonospora nanhaiensis TaxID=1323731 RepID=A0A853BUJ9_9ACTN|nr:quinone oxidoreductase [Streptomonospora nanhaiensis]MBX9391168.1 quinone oxidoreductase [Streptomonospora nanhaiensis]NYI98425.1 NADPH2:quinone reductase [Streptomonospora nanhaiensis]
MRAVVVKEPGGPEVLRLTEAPDPEPGPGEVVVDVEARGVNFIDIYQRSGAYAVPTPFVPGVEAAGTVATLGEGVDGPRVGARVAWAMVPGAYAERAVVPADRLVPVPDGVGAEQAAAVLLQGLTAHYLTHSTYPVQPGDTVLVHAAAGGTGLLLVQLAKARRARVIATVSTDAKADLARAAGADEVIRYDRTEVAPAVRELTGGAGVAAVYDGVGAATFDASLASLRPRGVLALFGQASGAVPPVDPQRLNSAGSVFLTRPTLAHYVAEREELLERASDVLGLVAAGALRVRVGGRYPLAEAARAHEDLAGRRTTGKLLLD